MINIRSNISKSKQIDDSPGRTRTGANDLEFEESWVSFDLVQR